MRTCLVIAALFMAQPIAAEAQRSIDIERFRPAVDADGFIGINGTSMPGPWQWNVSFWLNYSKKPLRASIGGEQTDLIRHRLGGDLAMQLGLGGRFALALNLPVVLHQNGFGRVPDGGPAIGSQAFGDPRITARIRVLGQPSAERRERRDGPGLALQGSVTLPLGDENAYAGEGAATFDVQAIGDFRVFGVAAGLMIGFRHRFETETIGPVTFRDELLYGIGINMPVPILEGLGVRLELRGALDAGFGGGAIRRSLENDYAITYARAGVTYFVGTGFSMSSGPGTPSVRAMAGLSWAPRAHDDDADLDGIPDRVDECPHLPEDFDDFQDEDGCTDPDNDNDFVPDVDDRCPLEASDEDNDADEDGCNDR